MLAQKATTAEHEIQPKTKVPTQPRNQNRQSLNKRLKSPTTSKNKQIQN
jgi:hypothetical protein